MILAFDRAIINPDTENIHILLSMNWVIHLHSMVCPLSVMRSLKGISLINFYDWTLTGMTNFIMNAGSSTDITGFDMSIARD